MEDITFTEESCVICHDSSSTESRLTCVKKGVSTLLQYCDTFQKTSLSNYLIETRHQGGTIKLHANCQRDITNRLRAFKRKSTEANNMQSSKIAKKTRSSLDATFNWKNCCFFCGNSCVRDLKHTDRNNYCEVRTLPFKERVIMMCKERKDELATKVYDRVIYCSDLVAAEARYHINCYEGFSLKKSETNIGRPVDQGRLKHFNNVCEWLESEAELYTLDEIQEKMIELAENEDVYCRKWLKTNLEKKYSDSLFFAEILGRHDVVCFRNYASYIINDKWYADRKEDTEQEAERIVTTAAKIILDEIRSTVFDCEKYPTNDELEDIRQGEDWIPSYLRLFLRCVIKPPLKRVGIGQSIVNATRPRSSLPPLLFGLGVEIDHVFGSKWILTELSRLGFSVGVDEVTRYKQSVVQNEDVTKLISENLPGSFTQWSADNVDHNVRTIDGKGTLHAMGIVSSTTNKVNKLQNLPPVKRQKKLKVEDVIKGKGIPVVPYMYPNTSGLSTVSYKPLLELQTPYVLPCDTSLDLLWHTSHFFLKEQRPSWSGYMTDVSTGDYPGKAMVNFLPIIDMNPNDPTCIYSTLLFITEQAKLLNIITPIITFDQPLWLKATDIIYAKSLDIVCILGGFHTMMSFMGSIGVVMRGSGLSDALEEIYGSNVVKHVMLGKDVARAIRGHFLAEAALVTKLLTPIIPVQYIVKQCNETDHDLEDSLNELHDENEETHHTTDTSKTPNITKLTVEQMDNLDALQNSLKESPLTAVDNVKSSEELCFLQAELQNYRTQLSTHSRTAKLWLQYVDYVDVIKLYIRAERTGNWNLHLVAVSRMINLFAATGHINYAKSARFYLQTMLELHTTYPWVYKSFAEHGYHTVRRSDRFWSGLWTDLIIEQVLMRSLKARGGLTRGRGVTESVRSQWINSMHRCAGIHNAMTNLTGAKHNTSEQHVELGESRVKRDNSDLKKLQQWFQQHEPFDIDEKNLKSIASGLTATNEDKINCDEAELVGNAIQVKLNNVCVADAKVKRSEQVRTLDNLQNIIKINNEPVQINPMLLFTRLIALVEREENMIENFSYELTPNPTSLFKDGMMRKPNKAVLRNALLNTVPEAKYRTVTTCVVDGGALLHKVKWLTNVTYGEVCNQYVSYLKHMYPSHGNVCIVFDGYEHTDSTKAHEHIRRTGKRSANVNINALLNVTTAQDLLLTNTHNKKQFIYLLSEKLLANGYAVRNSDSDADTLIVSTAIEYATNGEVIVVADDTDILVMLIYHWKSYMAELYFCTEGRKNLNIKRKMWPVSTIRNTQKNVDEILFVHAWGGCDTTSATHMKGKTKILQLVDKSEDIRSNASLFGLPSSTASDIGNSGVRIFIKSYQGKETDTLGKLRYAKYMEMAASATTIDPGKLPPTTRTAYFHALRVHLQVTQWKTLDIKCLKPDEWGWKRVEGILFPIMTDEKVAPDNILKFIRCKCKVGNNNTCATNMCTCKRNGLKCVQACGDCRGEECNNKDNVDVETEILEDDVNIDGNIFDFLQNL